MFIDDFDTSALGVTLTGDPLDAWRDGLTRFRRDVAVPGRIGTIPLTLETTSDPRTLTVGAVQRGVDVVELRAFLDGLKARLQPGTNRTVRVRFPDEATREIVGYCTRFTVGAIRPALTQAWHTLTIAFRCEDPLWYDLTSTQVDFTSSGQHDLALGTARVLPFIVIDGPVTDPTIIYRTAAGVEVSRMEFDITLGGGASLVIDAARQTIANQSGTNQADTLIDGDFPVFDPADGDFATEDWPTIQITPEPASATAEYRKAWL